MTMGNSDDENEEIRLTENNKEKSVEKIDGIVAPIMALDRCIRNGTGSGSVYDERGVIAFLILVSQLRPPGVSGRGPA